MLILSQNKEVLTDDIRLYIDSDYYNNKITSERVYSYIIKNERYILGIYKTKDRAKEILREIFLSYGHSNSIYEMPKE